MFTCGSHGSLVGIVIWLADGRFGIRIPTNVQTSSCTQPASYSVGTNGVLDLTNHLDIVPRLRMSGEMSPLPLTPSWLEQRQLYLSYLFTYITTVFVEVKGAMNVEWGLQGNWLTQSKSPENPLEIRLGEPQTGSEPLSCIS